MIGLMIVYYPVMINEMKRKFTEKKSLMRNPYIFPLLSASKTKTRGTIVIFSLGGNKHEEKNHPVQ